MLYTVSKSNGVFPSDGGPRVREFRSILILSSQVAGMALHPPGVRLKGLVVSFTAVLLWGLAQCYQVSGFVVHSSSSQPLSRLSLAAQEPEFTPLKEAHAL